jgi:flavin-dependent dehydrogenase
MMTSDSRNNSQLRVIGAGVAGSIMAYLATMNGLAVETYDISSSYTKPCGEAFPLWLLGVLDKWNVPRPPIHDRIHVFKIYDENLNMIRVIESKEPVWAIIDKAAWINKIRDMVGIKTIREQIKCSSDINGNVLFFDARGPFASKGRKVLVWQALAKNRVGVSGEAIQVIDFREAPGLVWMFSKGDTINIGGGFLGSNAPRARSLRVISRLFGEQVETSILEEKYSLVTIMPEISLGGNNCIRVGEAAGLVMSLGGEGIRPAVLSAIAAFESLRRSENGVLSFDWNSYREKLRPLIYQVRINKLIFSVSASLGSTFAKKVLASLDDDILVEWFEGQLGLKTSLPKLVGFILKSLLE